LSHNEGAVDLRRLKNVGSFVYSHGDEIIGPIKRVWLDEGRGCSKVGFDETDDGNKRMIQVDNGSLRGMSFRYRVFRYKELAPGEKYQLKSREIVGKKDKPIFIAEKWEPIHISALPDPFDASVGIGRSLERSLEGIEIVGSNKNTGGKEIMGDENKGLTTDQVRGMLKEELKGLLPDLSKTIVDQVRAAIADDAKPKIKVDTLSMKDLVTRARAIGPGATNGLMDLMFEGKTEPELLRFLNDEITKKSDGQNFEGAGGDGTQRGQKGENETQIRSFKDVDEDTFLNTIKNPGISYQ